MSSKRGVCKDCGREMAIVARGLCYRCYGRAREAEKTGQPGQTPASDHQATRPAELLVRLLDEVTAAAREMAQETEECVAILERYAEDVRELRGAYIRLKARVSEVDERIGGVVEEE